MNQGEAAAGKVGEAKGKEYSGMEWDRLSTE